MATTTSPGVVPPGIRLDGWDAIELWVGNARAAAALLVGGFGFRNTAYAGPETGVRDRASYVLEQGDVRLVVTAALHGGDDPVAAHVLRHGDGVHELAWRVDDVKATFAAAVTRGARPVVEPWSVQDGFGTVWRASVGAFGDTVHTFVDRSRYPADRFGPGYEADGLLPPTEGPAVGLTAIDHVVGNVELGRLDEWVRHYCDVFGWSVRQHFGAEQIATEYSALASTVVWDGDRVVMPLNEPAEGRRKSQIQEYLDSFGGPGVQHIALATDDIIAAVDALRRRGIRLMSVPSTYYEDARRRFADADLPWGDLERLQILVDRDDHGYLLQIFTETAGDRPTLFFEVIERRGGLGFGEGNFKALFEAIEREQARRGNL